jgi:adenylate cyclase class 2
MIEVELKFSLPCIEEARERFINLGAAPHAVMNQSDEYLNDPMRDFAELDLALRIRRSDENYLLTFKGPNRDSTAKIRQEIEMPLLDQAAAGQIKQIFESIGFFPVAKVVKRREELVLDWQNESIHVFLDDVEEVGRFVELELLVEDKSEVPYAKQNLLELAAVAGLTGAILTSYLELLLKNRRQL